MIRFLLVLAVAIAVALAGGMLLFNAATGIEAIAGMILLLPAPVLILAGYAYKEMGR